MANSHVADYKYKYRQGISRDILKEGNNIGVRAGGRGSWGCSTFRIPCGHCFIKIFNNKPKAIVQGFFSGVRKSVLRKVIHLKVNEKRN